MADILASVSVVLGAEISGFKAAMAEARRDMKGLVQFAEGVKGLGDSLTRYLTLPLAGIGAASVAASAKMESLKKGIEAISAADLGKQGITGLASLQLAASQAGDRLKVLEVIAKAPGIGFEQAVQGDIRLRAVGISATQSAKSLKEFANAISTTGGGANEFDRVTTQLAQLSAKGKVLSQDLRPIIEAAPAVSQALLKLYGTIDSETISASLTKQGKSSTDFIAVLTDELAKLPRVTGGLANAFENLQQTAVQSAAKLGDAISQALNLPGLTEGLASGIERLGNGFAGLSAPTQGLIVGLAGITAAIGPVLVGLGTLGLALPNIKLGLIAVQSAVNVLSTGFAALLNPTTLALAGAVALAGGAYYLATASERAHQAFLEQAAATRQLATEVSPLLDRYDQLKSKTSLSANEQEELRAIIEKVAQLMPEATTKIDSYGKVIDIAADKARKFISSNQGITKALALEDLPKQQAKLEKLEKQYANLTRQSEEFNRTGRVTITPGDKTSYGFDELGKTFFSDLQTNLNATSAALAAQRKELQQTQQSAGVYAGTLQGQLTPALTETELALKFLGGRGKEATGLLAGLHEQLKQLRQEQQDAPTAKLALAYVPLIKNLQEYIARLEGTDKAGKKSADAIAKLRQELSRLTALDNLLGNTPSQVEVLERRAATLTSGLKSLVDNGVSTASQAFKSFTQDLVNTSQAADKILAGIGKNTPDGEQLEIKPAKLTGLVPTTIGDTLPADVARLLGEYAKKPIPFELPVAVRLNMQAISDALQPVQLLSKEFLNLGTTLDTILPKFDGFVSQGLKTELLSLGAAFREISGAQQLGIELDAAGARASALQSSMRNLLAGGLGPASEELKKLAQEFKNLAFSSQVAAELKTSIMDLAGGIATAFSDSVSGLQSFGTSLASTLLSTVGDLAIKLGNIVLASGLGIQALEVSLRSFTGLPAIAAGLGLLAIGGIAKGAVTNLGKGGVASAAVSSPTPTNYGQNSNSTQKIVVEVVSRLRAGDLVAVGRGDAYRNRVGN